MNESNITLTQLRYLLAEQAERFAKLDRGYPREVLGTLQASLKSPAVLVITGLRRSGKSTVQAQLAHAHCPDDYYYLNFDDERWSGFRHTAFVQVHETLLELFGERKFFLMDEVQNIPGWERFVRRLQDAGHKVIVTGSNATLLSREIGSHLTGRHRTIEMFPFSFQEYLGFTGVSATPTTTAQAAQRTRALHAYLQCGGIPDALKYPEDQVCAQLYQDILYRDIGARYAIDSLKNLKELALFLVSHVGRPISFNKLRQMLMLGSVNTVKSYIDYLESSWLFSTVTCYSTSIKQQQIAPKKIYSIDNGIITEVAFRTTDDLGWLLENLVFLHLRRGTPEIFYAKNDDGSEVDFLIRKGRKITHLIQVTASLRDAATRKREVGSLIKAMDAHRLTRGTIVTLDDVETIRQEKHVIHVIPAAEWLVRPPR